MTINRFDGIYRFLSNFYPSIVTLDGVKYKTVEHAYQAAKTVDPKEREYVGSAETPGEAKKRGREVTKRPNWENLKYSIMFYLILEKFEDHILQAKLLYTGDHHLEEGNDWGDTYWGTVNGFGYNNLGRILMDVRSHYKDPKNSLFF